MEPGVLFCGMGNISCPGGGIGNGGCPIGGLRGARTSDGMEEGKEEDEEGADDAEGFSLGMENALSFILSSSLDSDIETMRESSSVVDSVEVDTAESVFSPSPGSYSNTEYRKESA